MSKLHRIPRGANLGVTFLGVELKDTAPLICSIFVALPISSMGSLMLPFITVLIGFLLTRYFVSYKKEQLDGFILSVLYQYSILGYSEAFNKQNKLFIGNSIILNTSLSICFL
jgi:hypothetical protein